MAVSGYVAERAESVGVPTASIEVIPNFVDLEDELSDIAEPRHPYVMYAGPTAAHKGRSVLLEAHSRLEADLELRLVGGDGTVSSPGVADVGFQTGAELDDLYRRAMMVVVPSIWADPCPTVALEAMAQGRPVIASDTGGLSEIVDHGVTGLLVRPGDATALREAIDRLAGAPSLRDEMGANARVRVLRFSTSAVLPRLEAVYARAGGMA